MYYTRAYKRKRRLAIGLPILFIVIIIAWFVIASLLQSKSYHTAVTLMNSGKYKAAAEAFENTGNYKDSKKLKLECELMPDYQNAIKLMEAGNYIAAKARFEKLGDYKDSEELAIECKLSSAYNQAQTLMNKGDYIGAKEAFLALGGFKDSGKRADECENMYYYDKANTLLKEGNYPEAQEAFLYLGDFKDSEERAEQCITTAYQTALTCMDSKDYEGAKAIFSEITNYKDSAMLLQKCGDLERKETYKKALKAYQDKNYYTAYQLFTDLGDYSDCKKRAKDCIRPYPGTKLMYKNKKYMFSFAPLVIHTGEEEPTYVKIYTTDNTLVATMFIRKGDSLSFEMPRGNFVIKGANGVKWYGEKEMFGDEGSYYGLDTKLEYSSWGLGYEITLYEVAGGNLGMDPVSNEDF